MRRPGLLAALVLFTLMACTGRSSGPPGSSSGVSGSGSGSGSGVGAGNGGGSQTPPPVEGDGKAPPADPGTGPACGDKTCAADEQCISYYGVAGPAGPKFQECGIPCQKGGGCPSGKTCQTIADGPGPVCR